MKKVSFVFTLLCATLSVAAQDSPRFAVKLYNSVNYAIAYDASGKIHTAIQAVNPSVAIQMRHKNPHFWSELELSNVKLYNTSKIGYFGGTSSSLNYYVYKERGLGLSVRYEYNYNFFKTQHKFMPSIGLGIMPTFESVHQTPMSNVSFSPFRVNTLGVKTYLTPRLTYNITPRWFVEASLPINVFSGKTMQHTSYSTINNPQGKTSSNYTDRQFFPKGSLSPRLGVGFRF
ncbi:MAG: hypothetical protein ACKVTZ_22275 [Bacteroidia bacterium]